MQTKPTERSYAPLFSLDFIMATVKIVQPRLQDAHFGLYRTSAGGDESIFVRRKVGDPTDYNHRNARKLTRQRDYLSLASQHYAHLTPSQKAITRHQFEEVEYETGHSRTETKLLTGRQLFISKEIHSLKTTGKQMSLPFEVCIQLTDEYLNPLEGTLYLYHQMPVEWYELPGVSLSPSDWLFSLVPPGMPQYHPFGAASGYFDFELPETFLSEKELKVYHYHKLGNLQEKLDWLNEWYDDYFYAFHTTSKYHAYDWYHPYFIISMAVHSKIKAPKYAGALKIGISAIHNPVLPEDWIAMRQYYIHTAGDEFKDFLSFFSFPLIAPWDTRYIVHQFPVYPPESWVGEITYWNMI